MFLEANKKNVVLPNLCSVFFFSSSRLKNKWSIQKMQWNQKQAGGESKVVFIEVERQF